MKFVINLTDDNTGRTKVVKVNASSFEEAKDVVSKRYPSYTIGRVSSDREDGIFFSNVRKLKVDIQNK